MFRNVVVTALSSRNHMIKYLTETSHLGLLPKLGTATAKILYPKSFLRFITCVASMAWCFTHIGIHSFIWILCLGLQCLFDVGNLLNKKNITYLQILRAYIDETFILDNECAHLLLNRLFVFKRLVLLSVCFVDLGFNTHKNSFTSITPRLKCGTNFGQVTRLGVSTYGII